MVIKSLTMIGNECEIIESFVRYNINIFDEMVFVFNFGSVDNSLRILKLLYNEGMNIRIYDEPLVVYEQKAIENKYIKMLADENDTDLIIPLDADEFVAGKTNPRDVLESLIMNRVYKVKWLNYLMTDQDNKDEGFIPKRMTYCDVNAQTYDKVFIPACLIIEKDIMVTTGHHDVIGDVDVEYISDLYIAHYPVTSWDQYQNKLYCSSITFINWMNRLDGDGTHINKMLEDLENGGEKGYYIYNISGSDNIVNYPLNTDFIENKDSKLVVKYSDESKINLTSNLIRIAQNMAIKAYRYEITDRFIDKMAVKVLVFGTGQKAISLFDGIPDGLLNVICYIDSDKQKKFTRFKQRLVITPDYIRMFDFEKIIISSQKYYNEMRDTLLQYGISNEEIVGENYIMDLLIRKLSDERKNYKVRVSLNDI